MSARSQPLWNAKFQLSNAKIHRKLIKMAKPFICKCQSNGFQCAITLCVPNAHTKCEYIFEYINCMHCLTRNDKINWIFLCISNERTAFHLEETRKWRWENCLSTKDGAIFGSTYYGTKCLNFSHFSPCCELEFCHLIFAGNYNVSLFPFLWVPLAFR